MTTDILLGLILLVGLAQVWATLELLKRPERPAEPRIEIPVRHTPVEPVADLLTCYYCNHQFPADRMEEIGHYRYCPEHGSARRVS